MVNVSEPEGKPMLPTLGSAVRVADDPCVQGSQAPRRLCVAFDTGHLLERGTDVALYDYAEGNEDVLGHRSLILCPAQADVSALGKFRQRFSVCLYRDRADLEHLLANVDVYYVQDHGIRPPGGRARPPHGRTVVHCVFEAKEPHGDVYAAISSWVAEHHGVPGRRPCPVVPYIVRRPPTATGDLRSQLGIPAGATVLGRHGGFDTFNIPFVHGEVVRALAAREDLWFVFLNTRPFAPPHPRLVHLPATVDLVAKARFVQTCDAMLHARAEGETFGLAVAEFSVCHKPVLTWLGSGDMYHAEVLGTKGIYYRGPEDLRRILGRFRPVTGDFDAYSRGFAQEVVMQQFAAVFLGATPASLREREDRITGTRSLDLPMPHRRQLRREHRTVEIRDSLSARHGSPPGATEAARSAKNGS